MQFQETEEQSMIREMVRDFAEEVLAPTCLARDKAQHHRLKNGRSSLNMACNLVRFQKIMEVSLSMM